MKERKAKSLNELKRGMIVRSMASGMSYVVYDNNGDSVTIAKILNIAHPEEWLIIEEGDDDRPDFNETVSSKKQYLLSL